MEEGKLFFLLLPLNHFKQNPSLQKSGHRQNYEGSLYGEDSFGNKVSESKRKTHQIQSLGFDDDVAIRCFRIPI